MAPDNSATDHRCEHQRESEAGAGLASARRAGTMGGVASRKVGSTVLSVDGVVKAYGGHLVLDRVSLTVAEGEAVALVGRNGSGKTTLLRCIIGADRPTEGTVRLLGEKVDETNPEVRRNIATVVDDLDFFPDLSVVEHLDLLARAHGVADPEGIVDEVLAEVSLVPQSGQLPGTLSSGQRRRLALATALIRPKKLIVLDEPEQRLDVQGVEWLGARLKFELSNGAGIIMASHDPTLVEAVGARIFNLDDEEAIEGDES